MFRKLAECLLCLLFVFCTLAGCARNAVAEEEQAILDYVRSIGVVDVEQLTEEQRQRLFDAGLDGVEEELRKMVEEYVEAHSQEPVLAPTVEYLRGWQGEKDGVTYIIKISKISSAEFDELMLAHQNGGTEQLETCIQEKWADGWAAVEEASSLGGK